MTYVIDASVVFHPSWELAGASDLFAPHLIDLEVASVMRKAVLRGLRAPEDAAHQLRLWSRNEIVRCSHAPFLERIWQLRDNITPYDASYVALAEHLDIPLLTADRRLAQAAAPHCAVVTVN